MPDNLLDQTRVDRRTFAVTSFAAAERADRAYWRSRTRTNAWKPWNSAAQSPVAAIRLPADFRDFLKLLNSHRVDYLLVGGYAVCYHGYYRNTGGYRPLDRGWS